MLCIVAKRTRYCDRSGNSLVDEISVTALSAAVDETRPFKLSNKFPYFLRHEITRGSFVALRRASGARLSRRVALGAAARP